MSTGGRTIRPPSYAGALLLVGLLDLALRWGGFARAVGLARRLAGKRTVSSRQRSAAHAVCHRVTMASVFYPGRALCLEQSLALYVLLRRRGIDAELKLGVQPYPFNAHAWVELGGQPLNESAETIREFVPMQGFAL